MATNNDWKNYRNRWVFLRGKKIKLRKYIYVSAAIMQRKNKKGWQRVNHVQNYKNALNLYGFKGLQIYEDLFYKGIPEPTKRTIWLKLALKMAPLFSKLYDFKNKVLKKFKR